MVGKRKGSKNERKRVVNGREERKGKVEGRYASRRRKEKVEELSLIHI